LSQLDLALRGGTSQRHLSFVESGRSVPSRTMLTTLSDALNIPLRERNALLLAAGYAPLYPEASLDDATMRVVTQALDQMLSNHEPHPAVVMDRYWNILRANNAAPAFFGSIIDLAKFPKPRNLLDLTFNPEGLRPHIEDWESVAVGLLQRVQREAVGLIIDDRLRTILDNIKRYPGADKLSPSGSPDSPILPITFRRGSDRISYFSLVTTIGTPQTVTAQELRLECMFPVNAPGASARPINQPQHS
jgi:transcriptional regulator with XRE-family HTH domain